MQASLQAQVRTPEAGAAASAPQRDAVALSVRGVHKRFGATHALKGVDFTLRRGTVHALLGANGCGKSTLVKVLAGYHVPDAGEIEVPGERNVAGSVSGSIAFVHQDLGLVGPLTVAENLGLSNGFQTTGGAIRWGRENRRTQEVLREYGIACEATDVIAALGPAEQTMVAIARAMISLPPSGGVLVLDEPTARLPVTEADRLLAMIRRLTTRGVAVLYISHRLDEVLDIADEVTVLRDGARVHHGPVGAMVRNDLVRLIVGRDLVASETPADAQRPTGPALLSVQNLRGLRVQGVSFDIRPGELLGVAGLVGSGRSELGRLVFGLQDSTGGSVQYDGEDATHTTTERSVARGMAYVPQERRSGIFTAMSVAENAILASLDSVMGTFGISDEKSRRAADEVVRDLAVKTQDIDTPIEALSGGNQQKVSLGKWLRRPVKLLILDEPTQGIDIGARTEIFQIIRRIARERGIAALVLDSDLDVLAEHCDRVLVMASGRIVHSFEGAALSAPALSHAVYGH
jgi:ribose transport system ATP-binding protein